MLPPGLATRLSARMSIDGRPSVSAPEPGRRHADGKMEESVHGAEESWKIRGGKARYPTAFLLL